MTEITKWPLDFQLPPSDPSPCKSNVKSEKIKLVGYIGLGLAGGPMAENIPKYGYKLLVTDADRKKAQAYAESHENVELASDSADAFREVDCLITMLPNGHVVREVLLGAKGVAPHLKRGTVIVDTSSSDPINTQKLQAELKERFGVQLVDAPVTQIRMRGINDGEATLMIGGEKEAVDEVLPVLNTMARWTFNMGGPGSGHVCKTFNNYMTAAAIAALNDCLVVGHKMGLDPALITDVMNVGTARNYGTAHSIRAEALTRTYGSGFGLYLIVKDLGINLDLATHLGLDNELSQLVHSKFKDALDKCDPAADYTESLRVWEERAGVKLPTYENLGEAPEWRPF
ncbi:hypothetical protein I302_100008 [Kwoniella bestiolae CBS 10118]|uniref:3-hydroxyisobutyrate dehydrogenase n=1 Tax=Kwoniella bestiolae CBS 10118 TaxID=1296100 RepID=A0A1B9G3S3_9TREE|nr:hypothetical protein I302_03380 [Kwoniella bestiolae CBS 10118]OCF25707.1 hypothetical protein I302_03380 [Kwoniella bestiolae CBS 10118]